MKNLKTIKVRKTSKPHSILNVKYCDTFLSKLAGLMFSKEMKPDHGLMIVEQIESRMNTSIHMLFMNYDITVLWLDKEMVVVDKTLAKKWFPVYIPKKPAKCVLELHSSRYSEFQIGDKLELVDEN